MIRWRMKTNDAVMVKYDDDMMGGTMSLNSAPVPLPTVALDVGCLAVQ